VIDQDLTNHERLSDMLKKSLLALVALLVLAGFLVARDWDSPELGRAVLNQVSQSTGIHVDASGFSLNLLKGLVLEDVSGTMPGEGGELTFAMDQLVFEHRIMPLLSGTVAIDRVLLASPKLAWAAASGAGSASPPQAAAQPPSPSGSAPTGTTARETGTSATADDDAASGSLALDVKLVRIENATLVVADAAGLERLQIDELDFDMTDLRLDPSREGIGGLSARGTLSVAQIRADVQALTDITGAFELADARFVVPELRFGVKSGVVVANTTIDFNPVPFTYALQATSENDLNTMLDTPGGLGPATAGFDAKGAGPDVADLVASGQVQLAAGQFPASPLFARVDAAIGKPVLSNATYEATTVSFRLAGNRVTLDPFRLTTPAARLDLSGTASPAGPIDFDIALATPREGLTVEGTSAAVLDVLADNEGWVPVPLTLTGTIEDPKVRPDVGTLASMAAQGARREATATATDALRGLIKRKIR
jgi:hypothetical protein